MKNRKIPWKGLAVALGVCAAVGAWAQPYVTIPAGCVVLVPGQGTPGPGQVGNNGVISMPDAFAGGTFSIAGVTSVLSWNMLGDLSRTQGVNPPSAATQSIPGNNFSVSIESYNKNLRPGYETANPFIARSKGRITVNYVQTPCNNFITFDVLKKWTTPNPQIIGPDCWQPNTTYVYAVDIASGDNVLDNIGFDKYYWQVTDGLGNVVGIPGNYSAESSSIQYTTPVALPNPPYTLKCCFGRNNNWDNGLNSFPTSIAAMNAMTSCVTKTILQPLTPAYTGGFPTCVNAVSPGPFTVVSSNPNCAYTYTWSRSNLSWLFTPSGTCGSGITVSSIGDGNPCTFFLNLTGPCGSSTFSYTINRNYNNAAMLAVASPYCASVGSFTVNLGSLYQGNQTCWVTLPGGWGAVNSGSANVTFTIPAAAAGSTNTINLFSCGACSSVLLPIVINVRPATPGPITGPNCVTAGVVSPPFSVPQLGTFTWTPPGGWLGGGTTNTVTFTPNTTAGTVSVVLNGQPGCPSLPATKTVNINPVVTQPACYNSGGMQTTGAIFTCNPGNASSSWTFPATLTPTTTATGASVTINTVLTPAAGSYACTVTTNGCTTPFNVVIPASTYTATVNETDPLASVIQATFNSTTYYRVWNCTTGTWVTPNFLQGTAGFVHSLTGAGPGSFAFVCDPFPLGGCLQITNCVTTVHAAPLEPGGDQTTMLDGDLKEVYIMPNPSTGLFTVAITHDFEAAQATLFDPQGRRVAKATRLVLGPNALDYSNLKPGIYSLVTEIDGETSTHNLVITKD